MTTERDEFIVDIEKNLKTMNMTELGAYGTIVIPYLIKEIIILKDCVDELKKLAEEHTHSLIEFIDGVKTNDN